MYTSKQLRYSQKNRKKLFFKKIGREKEEREEERKYQRGREGLEKGKEKEGKKYYFTMKKDFFFFVIKTIAIIKKLFKEGKTLPSLLSPPPSVGKNEEACNEMAEKKFVALAS